MSFTKPPTASYSRSTIVSQGPIAPGAAHRKVKWRM